VTTPDAVVALPLAARAQQSAMPTVGYLSGGSPGDPKFIELIPDQATWDDYCEAFAKEAA